MPTVVSELEMTLNDSLSVALWVTLWLLSLLSKLVELVRLPNGFGEYRRQCQ
ncbi:hypothetical protein PQG02_31920 (plasmid) [Nostoc sp. UHCC 0926]|uniref:hypothetical protein n=1 Tax=Nostoc sp. UHCC 0926 TaxID=3025190 RepID=UPI002360D303|nr:hypothetical protein [Nostoc sp. UHCC 0926]WDD36013.1 hypothetical protein PQG02_31920 [Nostoc sp. UHCC 0926]